MDALLATLAKILELERRQGCADRAVIGGLEGFLDRWQAQAAGQVDEAVRRQIDAALRGYGRCATDERRDRVAVALAAAAGAPKPDRAPAPRSSRARRAAEPSPAREGHRTAPHSVGLDGPVTQLRGVGGRVAATLGRLEVVTVRDLLRHAPTRYRDFSRLVPIRLLQPGEDATIAGSVWDVRRRTVRAGRSILTLILGDATGTTSCVFFNQPYLEREFTQGRRLVVSGTVELWQGRLVFRAPEWEPEDRDSVHTARLVPLYPLTAGLTQRSLRRLVKAALDDFLDQLADPLPEGLRSDLQLPRLADAVQALHFPARPAAAEAARARLAFDELLTLQLWARRRRRERAAQPAVDLAAGRPALGRFVEALPFRLTAAQARALDEIVADMTGGAPMSRLLQGDVGSGKTAVAAGAVAVCVAAGHQAVLMAPTEILADQHFASLTGLLAPLGYRPFDAAAGAPPADGAAASDPAPAPRLARLVGSLRPAEKAAIARASAAGEVAVLVGTHAVIQESVRFRRLGLAIADEQHRFGVLQRAELTIRGAPGRTDGPERLPHLLVMTATPIPRTLALAMNADLDQTVIDELPPGRKPVRTLWLGPHERERAYQFLRHRVTQGQQAYVVCPLIEESEAVSARAAVPEHERLATQVFPDLRVGLLHGRLRPAEKEAVMAAFYAGQLDILVSTSVIEVGVDVPNATVMLIEGADRFGLAQLHQFRGRVGRGSAESVCLLTAEQASPAAAQRLQALAETADGLALAELDLRMRGPGDYFGVRQSGEFDGFRFAREAKPEVLALAQRAATTLLDTDPALAGPTLAGLRAAVEAFSIGVARV